MTNNFSRQDIIKILIKQAEGFYYTEEQFEYEKTQNKSILNENIKQNKIICDFSANDDRGAVQMNFLNDTLKSQNETFKNENEKHQNLTLVKKKVATHFVSPDMHAIKILLEIFNEKIDSEDSSNLTDEELLNLKNKLLGDLLNEPNKDQ